MAKPSKSAMPSQSRPKPEKRKEGHFEKEGSKLSPPPKRTKHRNNGKAASTSQQASSGPRPPVRDTAYPASIGSAVDDAWKQAFCIEEMNIITASSIQKKVTLAVNTIVGSTPRKPTVVELHAKAPATSKMITVVEIAKRQIEQGGGKWFQYNKVEQVLTERKEEAKPVQNKGNGKGKEKEREEDDNPTGQHSEEEAGEEESAAFETMKTPFERANEGTAKVRAVPVMTIYLSHARVEELRKAYGEQTNASEVPKA